MLGELLKLLEQILQWLHELNTWINNNFGGILLVILTIAVIVALRRIKKNQDERESIKKLAEAIIRQYNKDLRESK